VKVEKLSISLDPDLGEGVRLAAERAGISVSAWLSRAAAAQLRRQALGDYLVAWQAKHGQFTGSELEKARAQLGFRGKPKRSP
jgi:hypothetical protein